MLDKLCNEAEWLLDGDTANERDHMRIVALSDLLHCINLIEKVCSLTSCGTGCMEGGREGGRERGRERGREESRRREKEKERERERVRERERETIVREGAL